jgi:hypothetical protein
MPYKDPEKRKQYHKEYHKKWSIDNIDSIKERGKKYFQKNKEKIYKRRKRNGTSDYNRFYQMKSRYGILENEYNELLIKQNNLCCICKQPNKKLCVDHNHDNKKIRGLLCRDCNSGLGMFKDNREYLLEAIKYLLKGAQ